MYAIDTDKFQVLLFASPGNIPCNVGTHSWFVINNYGTLSRWEILFRTIDHPPCWGHLYKNFFPMFQGIEIFPYLEVFFWKSRLLGQTEGAPAQNLAAFIERSPGAYPYLRRFVITGPNSNTYIQWVLDHFPQFPAKLPWNAFGKGYPVRESTTLP